MPILVSSLNYLLPASEYNPFTNITRSILQGPSPNITKVLDPFDIDPPRNTYGDMLSHSHCLDVRVLFMLLKVIDNNRHQFFMLPNKVMRCAGDQFEGMGRDGIGKVCRMRSRYYLNIQIVSRRPRKGISTLLYPIDHGRSKRWLLWACGILK